MNKKLMPAVLTVLLGLALLQPRASAQADSNNSILEQADKFALDGKLGPARDAYERAIKAGVALEKDYVRARNLALCYLNGQPQKLDLAAKWFQAAILQRPTADDTRVLLAQSLAWGGKYDMAIQQYRLLLNAQPGSTDYVLGLANTQYWKGDVKGALGTLERFLEQFPSRTEVRLSYARTLAYGKRYTDARNQYQAVLQGDRNSVAARVGIAKVTSWENQLDLALAQFDAILKSNPESYDALVGKAYTLMWMGKPDQARILFASARQRDPNDKEVTAALRSLGAGGKVEPKTGASVAVVKKQPPAVVARVEPPKPAPPVVETPRTEPPIVAEQRPPAPPPPPVDPVPALLVAAENAAGRSNYTEAIHHYHQALELRPGDLTIKLQIARVLSWSKDYDISVEQYDEVLKATPGNLMARTEKARVLSWNKKYDASLVEYKAALELAENSPAPPVPVRDIRMEYARVLSWAQQLDASLAQYKMLLPQSVQPEHSDVPLLIEMARVQAWSRHYDDSVITYDEVLKLDKENFDARLGKAQTTYWAGKLADSEAQLNDLLRLRPQHPETSFTLAAVEHGLGNNGRSLNLLKNAPNDKETEDLRKGIRSEMRPVLRFRYSLEDDREIVSVGANSTTKVMRYTSAIEFSVRPDVRMEIVNITTDGLTSNALLGKHSGEAGAMETFARINFKIKPWLQLTLAGGSGMTGGRSLGLSAPTRQHFVYDIHPIITRGDLRVDLGVSRHIADYTPLAIYDNVMQQRYSIGASYTWKRRVRTGAEYWYSHYNVDSPEPGRPQFYTTNATGGSFYVTPTIYSNDRVSVDGGFRYDSFTFDDGAAVISNGVTGIGSAGFFTPQLYQRIAGTGHVNWDPHRRLNLEAHGTFGPQRIFGFASLLPPPAKWGTTGSIGAQANMHFGHFHPSFSYDYFATQTAAFPAQSAGQYRSHVFSVGLVYRF